GRAAEPLRRGPGALLLRRRQLDLLRRPAADHRQSRPREGPRAVQAARAAGRHVNLLLAISRGIDRLNRTVGETVKWLVLAAVLISAGNAVVRYSFNRSSNAWLEIQWYLFAAIFLLCAGYTLLRNEHVRIDVATWWLSPRIQAWIDIVGSLVFLLPMALI